MLLKERNVAKIFLVGHSLGSIFASYFINHHSEYVKGYVNITGIINMWYVGLMTFYRTLAVQYKFSVGPNKNALMRLLNKNEYR